MYLCKKYKKYYVRLIKIPLEAVLSLDAVPREVLLGAGLGEGLLPSEDQFQY